MFAIVNHVKIHYQVFGNGKPIIILHGFGCDLRLMTGCLEPIFQNQSDYMRIYIDLPGMGASDAPLGSASSDEILQILISMIDGLNLDHFLLVGESYGGYLARGILASRLSERVDGLLLLCPVVTPEHSARSVATKSITLFDDRFLQRLSPAERAAFCAYAIVANEQTYERYKQEIEFGAKIANQEFLERLGRSYAFTDDIDQRIRALKYSKPVLLLAGRQDNCVGYRDLWNLIEDYPRATFAVLDIAGHNLQMEQPMLFDALVREWMMRIGR